MSDKSLKVQNIVATTSLGKPVSLIKLAKSEANIEYNPEQFPGLVLRIKKPKSAVLVFSSGNLVCTGTKSIGQVKEVINIVIKILRKIGVKVTEKPKINVQNIVASGSVNLTLNLNALLLELENTEYEPEQFPGLVYRLDVPKVVVLLFGSGKLIITGGKEPEDAKKAVIKILSDLRSLGLI